MNNTYTIKLHSVSDAMLFVIKCRGFHEDIDYCFGPRHVVDAKSILGILSGGFDRQATVIIHTDSTKNAEEFGQAISLWRKA